MTIVSARTAKNSLVSVCATNVCVFVVCVNWVFAFDLYKFATRAEAAKKHPTFILCLHQSVSQSVSQPVGNIESRVQYLSTHEFADRTAVNKWHQPARARPTLLFVTFRHFDSHARARLLSNVKSTHIRTIGGGGGGATQSI